MKCVMSLSLLLLFVITCTQGFAADTEPPTADLPVLKLQVKKGEVLRYIVNAEVTRKIVSRDAKEELLAKTDDILEVEMTQTCKGVDDSGNMEFEASYGAYRLVRDITEGAESRKEIYTPESLTLSDANGVAITKKWAELPASKQTELRKLFVQGFVFIATPNGEIKEPADMPAFERELPGINAIRLQQAAYYPNHPIEDGTQWNWKKPVNYPKLRDNPLSEKKIQVECEYELVESKEIIGIPCLTISIKEKATCSNEDEKSKFMRELTEKAHFEKANGMAVLVEGMLKSELSYGGLSKGVKVVTSGKFTIKRVEGNPDKAGQK